MFITHMRHPRQRGQTVLSSDHASTFSMVKSTLEASGSFWNVGDVWLRDDGELRHTCRGEIIMDGAYASRWF